MTFLKIKICCISSEEEVHQALNAGATALGFVGPMPNGPGIIPLSVISKLIQLVPAQVDTFLLTSARSASKIAKEVSLTGCNTVQIVDEIDLSEYPKLKNLIPGISLVQVIHVLSDRSIDMVHSVMPFVDMILLDSGNPLATQKSLGGTGRTHDWQISQKIRKMVSVPLYLAGGLNPTNIREAICTVNPDGVDVCTGVRTQGKLDSNKLRLFIKNANTI